MLKTAVLLNISVETVILTLKTEITIFDQINAALVRLTTFKNIKKT